VRWIGSTTPKPALVLRPTRVAAALLTTLLDQRTICHRPVLGEKAAKRPADQATLAAHTQMLVAKRSSLAEA
jgi:hypothetical protein